MNATRDSKVVTYLIQNAGTPVFVENGKVVDYLDPDGEFVQSLANSPAKEIRETDVLRISGVIFKNGEANALTYRTLGISAEKYASEEFAYSDNEDGSEIRISVPEFVKGRNKVSRKFNATAASVSGLRALSAKRAAIAVPVEEIAVPQGTTIVAADGGGTVRISKKSSK